MVETKPFRTKLCVLYQEGRCERETCTFAHGNGELRHFSGHFTVTPERRSYRGGDLRDKLDRKRSPETKYSLGRDSRVSHTFRRFSSPPPHKRRKYRAHLDMDGQNDFTRTFRNQDGTPERNKDEKYVASDFRLTLPDELKQVQYEVDVLLDQKSQLKIKLEERVQEADGLSSRIRNLETQLSEEKVKFKRVNSKFKTFVEAHIHHSRLEDQMRRSKVQLEQLVEELGIDAPQVDAHEDHLNVNIISDEEILLLKDHATSRKRPIPSSTEVPLGYDSGNSLRGHGVKVDGFVKSSHVRLDGKEDAEMDSKREDAARPYRESKSRRQKDASKSYVSSDKVLESHLAAAPPTGMAAHAVDDFVVDIIDAEDNSDAGEFPTPNQSRMPFPLPPLPPMTQNNYLEHQGDENVDVDVLDAEC